MAIISVFANKFSVKCFQISKCLPLKYYIKQVDIEKLDSSRNTHFFLFPLHYWLSFYSEGIPTFTLHSQPTLAITCSKLTIETREQSEIYSKLTIRTPERRHWPRSGVFIVNFEHISHLLLVFLLLTLSRQMPAEISFIMVQMLISNVLLNDFQRQ